MSENQGWIAVHRKILDNPLWLSEPFTKAQAWLDLLLLANHQPDYYFLRGNKIDVKRGEIARGQDVLAKRWKWSKSKVRNFLKLLENELQIEVKKSNIINKIVILNYEKHQQNDQQKDRRKTAERPQSDQQKDTNNNDNNDNNVNNYSITIEKQFEEFWELYNFKENKQGSFKEFKKAIKIITFDDLMINLKKFVEYHIKKGNYKNPEEKQYIKRPQNWLKGRCWENQITEIKSSKFEANINEDVDYGESGTF